MKRRRLADVAAEYAAEISGSEQKLMKSERVCEVLRRQHGGAYPVALNSGTRPVVCRALADALGKAKYEELCAAGSSPKPDVPAPRADPAAAPCRVDSAELRRRFPRDAAPLLRDGAQRFALLHADEVRCALAALASHPTEAAKSLTPSQGNGREGAYARLKPPLPPLLRSVMDAAREWIEAHAGALKLGLGSHALLLRYGRGGVNYCHHDACGDFQALLMLSTPGRDYRGGKFFLADRDPPFATREFPFEAAGELLVFRGNKGHGDVDWLHGMTEVEDGSAGGARRFAVGLFQ